VDSDALSETLTPQILASSFASSAAAPGVTTHDASMVRMLKPLARKALEKKARATVKEKGP